MDRKCTLSSVLGAFLSLVIVLLIYFVNWREGSSIWIYENIHPLLSKLPINEDTLDNMYFKFTEGLKGMIKYTNTFTTKGNMTFMLILAVISWLLECIRLYVVFYTFNVEMNFASIVVILLLANVIGVLSLLPGGMGSIEISWTGLFVLFGVPSVLAGSIALADRLVSFWAVNVPGIIFSSYYAKDILGEIKNFTIDLKLLENKEKD